MTTLEDSITTADAHVRNSTAQESGEARTTHGETRYPRSISVIIPCYNDGQTIRGVLEELLEVTAERPHIDWEIIVVDDCSSEPIDELIQSVAPVKVIEHPQNRGYGAALKSGIRAAQGEVIVTLDADGQHDPRELYHLVAGMDGYALSAGNRVDSSGVPHVRRPGKWFLGKMMNYFARQKIPDINCGFRAFHRDVILRYVHLCSDRFSFSMSSTLALLSEGHFVRFIDVRCRTRQGADSQVRVSTAFSAFGTLVRSIMVFHPLRVFTPITAFLVLIGISSLAYDITHGPNISDASLLLLICSLIIFLFGLVSDQISRMRRELYTVK